MNKFDKAGIIASTMCAIHCAILPILILLFPVISLSFFITEFLEFIFLVITLVLGLFSICFGIKIHKNWKILFLISAGFSFILVGKLLHSHNSHSTISFMNFMMVFGGLTIAFSHYLNNKLCNACKVCSKNE